MQTKITDYFCPRPKMSSRVERLASKLAEKRQALVSSQTICACGRLVCKPQKLREYRCFLSAAKKLEPSIQPIPEQFCDRCPTAIILVGWKYRGLTTNTVGILCMHSKITLMPEPTNQLDPNAIKVLCDDQFVGYVSRQHQDSARSHIQSRFEFRGINANGTAITLMPLSSM